MISQRMGRVTTELILPVPTNYNEMDRGCCAVHAPEVSLSQQPCKVSLIPVLQIGKLKIQNM